ncbi:porin [Paraburkholderia xenovorans]|uniref:porin n=1 Tax=Paraburkholderia xenovorans TaxID=36873 RepID=UPI001558D4B8|nr:porin [Paraburkholderia xenovorans]NPT37480.1 porin [Paraburkholderia xenovorans]
MKPLDVLYLRSKWALPLLLGTSLYATHANAQSSVTLYGIVDNSLEYLSNVSSSKGQNHSLLHMAAGSQDANRFGFRGVENLGGGMKAIMVLEAGFNVNTGQSQQNGRLFGRQAYVGLKGSFGTVTLGRQRTLIYDYGLSVDPLSYYSYALASIDSAYVGRVDNSIKYAKEIGNFNVSGLFSTGYDATITNGAQVPGAFRIGKEYSVGVGYNAGAFNSSVVFDQRQGTSIATQGNTERRVSFGAAYVIGKFKPFFNYEWYNSSIPATARRYDLYSAGLQYHATPALSFSGALFWENVTSANQRPYIVAGNVDYLLSKRTHLFAEAGFARNTNGSKQGLTGYGTEIVPGSNQLGVAVGLAHFF